ncbi:leucine-rich repeat-containing protein 15-like [Octopus sinensis]|uniref:Leucine-rich repeat-containing protein 15-like n=1 Tax=Octopus sinensis TaxID=2607531 RepID=A0A7E6FQP0_9MOLL|nr:leucine-rich repeat-containing protein 15-like [Octopus sinensis]
MFHQLKSTFVLVLFLRLFLESRAALDICIKCSCQGNRINCSSRNLTSVPRPIPPNIEYLNLTFNHINEIKPGTFQNLPNLTTLYLNNNDIKELKAGSFQNLPSLGGLYLHENNISEIHVEAFQKLPNLVDLYLNNNDIKELKAGSFQNLPSLRTLTTYSNHINEIKPGTFQNLPNLRYLVSHKNDIKEIHAGAFQNLPSLREILLYDNDIKELKAGSFENLPNLRVLVLHENDIKEIHAGAFQNLPRLDAIYLHYNDIKELKAGSFQNLPSLTTLVLAYNDIRKIESGAFQNLPSLTDLDLKNNTGMMCGCYLPALVNYTKTTFNRKVTVRGQCQADVGNNQTKSIPILEYSECKSWTNSFVFYLIFNSTLKKFNEYKSSGVNISRAIEHELSNLTGTFEVAYCGSENNSGVFTINCTVSLIFTKDQIFKQVSETFKTSQTLRDLGLQQGNTELFDEMAVW